MLIQHQMYFFKIECKFCSKMFDNKQSTFVIFGKESFYSCSIIFLILGLLEWHHQLCEIFQKKIVMMMCYVNCGQFHLVSRKVLEIK